MHLNFIWVVLVLLWMSIALIGAKFSCNVRTLQADSNWELFWWQPEKKNVMIVLIRHPYHSVLPNGGHCREELHHQHNTVSHLFEISENLNNMREHDREYAWCRIFCCFISSCKSSFQIYRTNGKHYFDDEAFSTLGFICKNWMIRMPNR